MAPELLAANTEASSAADMFSLGAQCRSALLDMTELTRAASKGHGAHAPRHTCGNPCVQVAGATLYECIGGESLPRSVPLEAALERLDVSMQLRQLIAALLRPDPAARPSAHVRTSQIHRSRLGLYAEQGATRKPYKQQS